MARTRIAVVVAVLTLAGLLAPAAGAATKPFSVRLTPQTSTGSSSQVFEAVVKNLTATQQIGSYDLIAPAYTPAGTGFFIQSAAVVAGAGGGVPKVTKEAGAVHVRSTSIAPGRSQTVRMVVDTTTVAGAWTWSALAKQSNDFNGAGNDLDLDTSSSALTTTILSGEESTTAQCPEEPVGDTQTCKLVVTYQEPGFRITIAVQADPGAGDNAGELEAQLPSPKQIDCPGLTESSPVTGLINGPANRSKTVTFTIDADADFTSVPEGLCYAGPLPSAINPAYVAPGLPFTYDGALFFPSVLPDCSEPASLISACVSDRRLEGGDQVLVVQTPSIFADPMYRG